MTIAGVLGWTGTVCIITLNLPQVWRTCVHGRTAGVPASRAWVAIAVALVWLGYGLYGGGLVQVVLNGAVIFLNALLLTRLARGDWGRTAGVVVVGLVVILLGGVGGREAVGLLGAVAGTGVCLPQMLALRAATRTDGVSALSLWLQAVGAVCWLSYGLLRSETVVWVPNVFVLATTFCTLALLARSRVHQPDVVADPVKGVGQQEAVAPRHDVALAQPSV